MHTLSTLAPPYLLDLEKSILFFLSFFFDTQKSGVVKCASQGG